MEQFCKDRIDLVIQSLRGQVESTKGVGFNMDWFNYVRGQYGKGYDDDDNSNTDHSGRNCGTVACIAGTIAALEKSVDSFGDAAVWLGLGNEGLYKLFYARHSTWQEHLRNITLDHAIEVLEIFRDTGLIHWDIRVNPDYDGGDL